MSGKGYAEGLEPLLGLLHNDSFCGSLPYKKHKSLGCTGTFRKKLPMWVVFKLVGPIYLPSIAHNIRATKNFQK